MRTDVEMACIDFGLVCADAIKRTEEAILTAVRHFLISGKDVIPSEVAKLAHQEVQKCNLPGVFNVLRPQAARLAKSSIDNEYWDLVDAIGFYADATGSDWPYLTMTTRDQRLTWAAEKAATLQAQLQ